MIAQNFNLMWACLEYLQESGLFQSSCSYDRCWRDILDLSLSGISLSYLAYIVPFQLVFLSHQNFGSLKRPFVLGAYLVYVSS